ncbi:RNA polymerase sigma factor, partial [Agrobacterium rubi]|nr:RNA polymerase sigma factor [Agrobacterium rubi]
RDILEALDRLSDDQKSLLLLVGVEDLSYEQAAAVIGVPVGTVMSRLSRARQKFRSILDNKTPVTLRRVK